MLMRKSSSAKPQAGGKQADTKVLPTQELSEVPADGAVVALRLVREGKRALLEITPSAPVARLDVAAARMLRNEIGRFLEAAGAK